VIIVVGLDSYARREERKGVYFWRRILPGNIIRTDGAGLVMSCKCNWGCDKKVASIRSCREIMRGKPLTESSEEEEGGEESRAPHIERVEIEVRNKY
jgi:hypothetical protein